jgi:uncharacterized NAD-dependent epimerase/dehydratase family protein
MHNDSARNDISSIAKPYLLFLGDVRDPLDAKTALGIRQWRPEWAAAQLRLPGCAVDLGLPELDPRAAKAAGIGSLVVGIAPDGGQLPAHWRSVVLEALDAGLDVVAGLHSRLAADAEFVERARSRGRRLVDVRNPPQAFPPGNGAKRSGKRLLTVGTDCAVGKKYTVLALERELRARGIAADYRATGQTGVLIAERGVAIDAVISDFVAGAAEWLSPANAPDHWDLVEGQGSLFHPSYAAVTLGLIHGSQPDALVLCHESGRAHIGNFPDYPIPPFAECMDGYMRVARLTNKAVRFTGVSLNTSALDERAARAAIDDAARETGLPCCDPVRFGCATLADAMLRA